MKRAPLFLSLLFLVSCAARSHPDYSLFPFTDDKDMAYLFRNGDNYGKKGLSYSYKEVARQSEVASINAKIGRGESIFLYLYQDSCEACRSIHDDMVAYFLESGVEVWGVDFTIKEQGLSIIDGIKKVYPALASGFDSTLVTPSGYLIKNGEKVLPLGFLSERESLQKLEEFFKNQWNYSMVFTFTEYDAFVSFSKKNDTLALIDDGTVTARSAFLNKALHTSKATALLELTLSKPAEVDKFKTLGYAGDLLRYEKGEVKEKASSNTEEAKALIERYCA